MLKKISLLVLVLIAFFQPGCEKERDEKLKLEIVDLPIAIVTGPTSVEINWVTNLPANSVVYHGLTDALGDTVMDEEDREIHTIMLTNLVSDTNYYYIVESSSDYFSKIPQSDLSQFNTAWSDTGISGDLSILSGPEVVQMGPISVEISWETNLPGNSVVYYGLTTALGDTVIDDEERELHAITLVDLMPDTVYYFMVESNSNNFSGVPQSPQSQFATQANEESHIVYGWLYFSQEEYINALSSFNDAIYLNSEYGPAYAGRGWVYLRMENYSSALENFDTGLGLDITQSVIYAGRSLINLAQQSYSEAISDAQIVINVDSTYQFEYETSINYILMRLVMSQAYYATQEYQLAQEQCDIIDPENGLDLVLPGTWVVNSVTYDTYLEALLGLIQYLVLQQGGG